MFMLLSEQATGTILVTPGLGLARQATSKCTVVQPGALLSCVSVMLQASGK